MSLPEESAEIMGALKLKDTLDGWPDPESLGDDLPPVPAFGLELLPESFRPLAEDIAYRMQVPLDFPAAVIVVALAGCVNRRACIQPKANDDGFIVIPNLWGCVVATPGKLKSPVQHAVTASLRNIESQWREQHAAELKTYNADLEKEKIKKDVWASDYRTAVKKQTEPPPDFEETVIKPVKRQLLAGDVTPEKLQEILSDNPAGVMILRDELFGLLKETEKEGRETQRTFLLEAWNGYGAHDVQRIGRGDTFIPNVCMSVFGNMQPARLRSYLQNTLDGGAEDDGLFPRIQLFVYADECSWQYTDQPSDKHALALAEKIFSKLANLPTESIKMRFASDAQQLFVEWLTRLEQKIRNTAGVQPALIAHISKYRSLMPKLAGLFELADLVAHDFPLDTHIEIQRCHAEQAIAWCEYLEGHAHRIYSCIVSPANHAARELGKHITRGALPDSFTARDVYQHGWTSLKDAEAVEKALGVLRDAGWVRADKPARNGDGRPSKLWFVNPKVERS